MADNPISPVSSGNATNAPQAPTSANPTTAGHVASVNAPAEYTNATLISNMADVKEKAPKVYKAMMQGIAQSIIGKMRAANERLKKIQREGRH